MCYTFHPLVNVYLFEFVKYAIMCNNIQRKHDPHRKLIQALRI